MKFELMELRNKLNHTISQDTTKKFLTPHMKNLIYELYEAVEDRLDELSMDLSQNARRNILHVTKHHAKTTN